MRDFLKCIVIFTPVEKNDFKNTKYSDRSQKFRKLTYFNVK